jgi:glycosyltransferase involved in cell wall biosynthesis
MHIVIINYAYDPAYSTGSALLAHYYSLTEWAEALLAAGAQVTVLQRYARDERIERAGVSYWLVGDQLRPNLAPYQLPLRLHRLAARLRPSAVHLNGLCFPLQSLALRAQLPRGSALLAQHHAERPAPGRGPRGRLLRALSRAALRQADGLLFTADELAQPWRAIGAIGQGQLVRLVPEASTALAPIAYDRARAQSGICGDPALLWVGNLNSNKDPLAVLEGFAQALPALPKARLAMIYIEETLLPQVRARASQPDLAGRVELRGRVAHGEMAAYYSAADLFVLGSHRESCGYALFEALACGATPLVTDIAAFRALTQRGVVGALWPPGNAAALAAALLRVAGGERAAQRHAAKSHFAQHLSWHRVAQQALDVYQEAVARRQVTR